MCPTAKHISLYDVPCLSRHFAHDALRAQVESLFLKAPTVLQLPNIYKHTYLDLAHLGEHARHMVPPLRPSQPVIADENLGAAENNLPEVLCFLCFS